MVSSCLLDDVDTVAAGPNRWPASECWVALYRVTCQLGELLPGALDSWSFDAFGFNCARLP